MRDNWSQLLTHPGTTGRYDDKTSWRSKEVVTSDPGPIPSRVAPSFADDGEAVYLRRLAMSTRPGAPPLTPPVEVPFLPLPPAAATLSGEEAYLRRLALSGAAPPPEVPVYASPPKDDEDRAYIAISPPPNELDPSPLVPDLSAEIKARRDAAAAIAARLAQLAPGPSSSGPPTIPDAVSAPSSSRDLPMEIPE